MTKPNTPRLSIITPIFNCAEYFTSSYQCLTSQNLKEWEWILVDDGSTDSLSDYVQKIDDDRINYLQLPRNMGRGYARNYALMNASSRICVNWDIDDAYPSNRLDLICSAMNEGIDFCYEPVDIVDKHNHKIKSIEYAGSGIFPMPFHNTLSFRTSLGLKYLYQMLGTVGGIGEDYYFVLALSSMHKGVKLSCRSQYYQSREVFSKKSLHSHIGALLAFTRFILNRHPKLRHKVTVSLFFIPKTILALCFYSMKTLFEACFQKFGFTKNQ